MTIGLIISRGIYSSIRRRLAATNPRPIASKFSLERVEYRRTLLEKKEESRRKKKRKTVTEKHLFDLILHVRLDSQNARMKFSRNPGGSRRLRRILPRLAIF